MSMFTSIKSKVDQFQERIEAGIERIVAKRLEREAARKQRSQMALKAGREDVREVKKTIDRADEQIAKSRKAKNT